MRDSDVRKATLRMLIERHANEADTRIVEEMGIWSGSVRIDIAVINGELCGFELKSDRDTLQRLPLQQSLYSRVFDRMDIVVGGRHADNVLAQIPEWWGVKIASLANGNVCITEFRDGELNPELDAFLIAQLLWKTEVFQILETENLLKGWRSKKIKLLHQRLACELPLEKLRKHVRAMLKARQGWLRQNNASQFYVPIHSNSDPMFKIAG